MSNTRVSPRLRGAILAHQEATVELQESTRCSSATQRAVGHDEGEGLDAECAKFIQKIQSARDRWAATRAYLDQCRQLESEENPSSL